MKTAWQVRPHIESADTERWRPYMLEVMSTSLQIGPSRSQGDDKIDRILTYAIAVFGNLGAVSGVTCLMLYLISALESLAAQVKRSEGISPRSLHLASYI